MGAPTGPTVRCRARAFPLEVVKRGVAGDENFGVMIVDMLRAYHLALRWKITGDEAYARDAVKFLNAWSSTLKELGGNSNLFLSSGLYGNTTVRNGGSAADSA